MGEVFTHAPLEHSWQIRLVELQPHRPGNDYISCQIRLVPGGDAKDLDQEYDTKEDRKRIPYRALSYTWGEKTDTVPIKIDNKLHYVTTSLFMFLKQLRPQEGSESEFFWIDAISINQNDVSERNEQVYRMTSIYANAKMVDIWLGPAADDSDNALLQMEFLAGRVGAIDETWRYRISGWSKDASWSPFGPEKLFEQRILTAIIKLMERPWWMRVWVVQEATVPDQENWLICGKCSILLSHFYAAFFTIVLLSQYRTEYGMLLHMSKYALVFHKLQDRRATDKESLDLVGLLEEIRNFMATDDRDRIFALLGVAVVDRDEFPSPDYSKNVKQVYREVVQYFMMTSPYGHKLDILGYSDDFSLPWLRRFNSWFNGMLHFPLQLPVLHFAEIKQEIMKLVIPTEMGFSQYEELLTGCMERIKDIEAMDPETLSRELRDFIHGHLVWLTKFARASDTFLKTNRFGPVYTLLEEILEPEIKAQYTSDEATKWPKRVFELQSVLGVSQAGCTDNRTFQPQAEEWPSWLPDWRHEKLALSPLQKKLDPLSTWFGSPGQPQAAYSASGQNGEIFQSMHDQNQGQLVEFNDDKLKLRGFRVDCVKDLKRLNLDTLAPNETLQTPKERLEPAIPYDIGPTYMTGESIPEAFWRTVTADLKFDRASGTLSRVNPPDPRKYTPSYLSIFRKTASSILSTISGFFQTEILNRDETLDPCNGRQLAITEDRLMALVPRSAQLGDEIWLLGGGQVFHVLRPCEESFKLIGESYLHGFMDGEALRRLESGSAKVQSVTIM